MRIIVGMPREGGALPVPRLVATAEQALPPGRLDLRAGEDVRLVYTFLSPAAWQALERSGRLTARETDYQDFRRPFAWMSEQMTRRLGSPPGTSPLWVWVRTTRRDLVDEARTYLRHQPGTVLATCRIPDSRLLVSDFLDWCCVLLPTPVWPDGEAFDEAACDRWNQELALACPDSDTLFPDRWPEPFRSQTLESWQVMFQVDRPPRHRVLQGCVAELRADDVVRAVQLCPRRRAPH